MREVGAVHFTMKLESVCKILIQTSLMNMKSSYSSMYGCYACCLLHVDPKTRPISL